MNNSEFDFLSNEKNPKKQKIKSYYQKWYRIKKQALEKEISGMKVDINSLNICNCQNDKALIKKRQKGKRPKPKEGLSLLAPYWAFRVNKGEQKIESIYGAFRFKRVKTKSFYIRYNKKLSSVAKVLFNTFKKKHLHYAIDDILYSFKSNPKERDDLLTILYSPVLSLHNNFSIDLFDIWIKNIDIKTLEVLKKNELFKNKYCNLNDFEYIKITFSYKKKTPPKKKESLW